VLYIHPDDGDVFTKICRRDRNCIAVYTMCEYVGFVNKICTGVKQFFLLNLFASILWQNCTGFSVVLEYFPW
jgi:hypothetical protein